ncbi:MAG: RNB domain-containing ribonuclease [Myxococcales bacterium]|nr:RNB domain-containing ribonuclease [Myxococcales bacterium]
MPTPDSQPLLEALDGEVEHAEATWLDVGVWRVRGRIRAEVDDWREAVTFLEELGAEAVGAPVFLDAPVVDGSLEGVEAHAILSSPDRKEDVVHVRVVGPGALRIVVRDAERNLSSKRNRLPQLRKKLSRWQLEVQTLGRGVDVAGLSSQPAVVSFLAPFLAEAGVDAERVHGHKVDSKRGRLDVMVDAEHVPALELMRLGRRVRDATDIDVSIRHRIAGYRARDLVYAALGELEVVEGHQVQFDDRIGGVACTIDAPESEREGLQRFVDRWAERLGVPVLFQLDRKREVMVDRLAQAFPEEGILTAMRHVEDKMYTAEAMLPLGDHDDLLAWTDQMEEDWGVQILLEDPRLRAPDLRYRERYGSDAQTIALRYNRPQRFPDGVEEQARALVAAFDLDADVASGRRRDLRETVVISIDPTRTKDLDDALSIEELAPGRYRIGVHIADVASFVPQDTPLDREALKRSFTTYLVEGEIPVLPPILADEVCSLHGGQDSPALSLLVELTDDLEVLSTEVVRTAIHNHCRLDYSGAQAVLDGADHEHAWRLRTLDRLAQALRAARKQAGSLDLNLGNDPEKRSHQLIEEFMLLANECVARFLGEHHPDQLCLYRVHPHAGDADWGALQQVAQYLGLQARVSDQASLQRALEEAASFDEGDGPNITFLVFRYHVGQVLEKATYHFEQLGHGALAKQHYAHFTSPIRRYPDLIVHRLIDDALYREERDSASSYQREQLLPIQQHVDAMEIRVDAASFESHRLRDLQAFDGRTRVEDGILVGLLRGRAAVRLDRTDLSVSVRYRDDKTLGIDMPVRANDQITGFTLSLGQRVTVRTTGVDWGRASVEADIIRVGGDVP